MPKLNILINSKTSGKFHRENIDGRSHLVTTMMPIRGDITMNNIFYPDNEIESSFMQLNMLPAPNGHPTVNGVSVPAFHPVANNKHNIGGFLRNPRKKGKRVFVDFLIDEEVASNTKAGKETIKRIVGGEKIGVSTGLTISKVINKTGSDDFGKKYQRIGGTFNFDHVATLLNEKAAGDHAGTKMITNDEDVLIYNSEWKMNELSTEDLHSAIRELLPKNSDNSFLWIKEIYPLTQTFVYSLEDANTKKSFKQGFAVDENDKVTLVNDKIEVIENPDKYITKTITNEVDNMDKNKLVLAIIGNSANKYTVADNDRLVTLSDDELLKIVNTATDVDSAKEILTNSGFDFKEYEVFKVNKGEFNAYLAKKEEAQKETIECIVKNSEYTAEMLKEKSDAELTVISNMLTPEKVAARIGEQGNLNNNSADAAVNYS